MDVTTFSALVSAICAVFSITLTLLVIKENSKTRQLQLFNDVFKSIKETEAALKNYKNSNEEEKKEWDSLLFNTIEYFSFLINNSIIDDKRMVHFFSDAIIRWYEDIFLKHYSKKEIKNLDVFPEFRKLYSCLKTEEIKKQKQSQKIQLLENIKILLNPPLDFLKRNITIIGGVIGGVSILGILSFLVQYNFLAQAEVLFAPQPDGNSYCPQFNPDMILTIRNIGSANALFNLSFEWYGVLKNNTKIKLSPENTTILDIIYAYPENLLKPIKIGDIKDTQNSTKLELEITLRWSTKGHDLQQTFDQQNKNITTCNCVYGKIAESYTLIDDNCSIH